MQRLIIDDQRFFAGAGAPVGTVIARTLEAGEEFLFSQEWDEVYLDHDLGMGDTIRPLVAQLEERCHDGNPWPIGVVHVITANPAGQAWIVAALHPHYDVRITNVDYDFTFGGDDAKDQ